MKTYSQLTSLNYFDISFFTGKSTWESKTLIAGILDINELTQKGVPKVKIVDTVKISDVKFNFRSNTPIFDGKDIIKYMVEYYNAGVDNNALKSFGENKTYIKKLKFTGTHKILNDILNDEQYLKLQKIWFKSNIYGKSQYSNEAKLCVMNNQWAKDLTNN